MAHRTPRTPPAPQPAPLLIEHEPPPPFDRHGFDPAEFEWRPVPRRARADGWTPEVQRRFIETLAETGMVAAACAAVDMSEQSAYRLRRAPGSESFARAWAVALDAAADALADMAFARAIEGVDTPVFDRDGCRIGAKRHYSDRLMMFLLRAYRPERFRHAHQDVRHPGEAPALAVPPLAQAVAALAPATPPDPHLLTTPERLEDMVLTARAVAEVDVLHPADDRERYVRPCGYSNHPAAEERRLERHRREMERAEREGRDWAEEE